MIRSRFLLILLLLAYLGMTPAGMATCACIIPGQPVVQQGVLGSVSEPSVALETAVSALLSYFSLSIMIGALFLLAVSRKYDHVGQFGWNRPYLFSEPPPTPPPHFA
jgi:hypothetical protein